MAIAHSMYGEKNREKMERGKQRAAKMVRFCFARCELYVSRKQIK